MGAVFGQANVCLVLQQIIAPDSRAAGWALQWLLSRAGPGMEPVTVNHWT